MRSLLFATAVSGLLSSCAPESVSLIAPPPHPVAVLRCDRAVAWETSLPTRFDRSIGFERWALAGGEYVIRTDEEWRSLIGRVLVRNFTFQTLPGKLPDNAVALVFTTPAARGPAPNIEVVGASRTGDRMAVRFRVGEGGVLLSNFTGSPVSSVLIVFVDSAGVQNFAFSQEPAARREQATATPGAGACPTAL